MKLQSFILTCVLGIITTSFHAMESGHTNSDGSPNSNSIVINTAQLPFLKTFKGTQTLDDTSYSRKIDTQSLAILIIESNRYTQTQPCPHFFELVSKIKRGVINFNITREGTTLLTEKDLYHRLCTNIRALGCPIRTIASKETRYGKSYTSRSYIPVIIANQFAYFSDSVQESVELLDFSSNKEISSQNYTDCKKAVDAIVQKYQTQAGQIL